MLITTCQIDRRVKEYKGLVFGTSGRTRGIAGHIRAQAEQLIGGKATAYVEAMSKARNMAIDDLTANAEAMGANAVIGCDFDITDVMDGYILISISGTAVVLE
jgi:uncharacterized protein YbjQ (UPF0145 family)